MQSSLFPRFFIYSVDRIYRYLNRNGAAVGIPQALHFGQEGKLSLFFHILYLCLTSYVLGHLNTLVVNLMGKSLENVLKECKGYLYLIFSVIIIIMSYRKTFREEHAHAC